MRFMARKIARLSSSLDGLLRSYGFGSKLSEYRVFGKWDKAVGAAIARHARPLAVRGTKLALVVDSPAWMQQLSLMKPQTDRKSEPDARQGRHQGHHPETGRR